MATLMICENAIALFYISRKLILATLICAGEKYFALHFSEICGNAWHYNAIVRPFVRDKNYVILCGIVRDYAPHNCNISGCKQAF